MPPVHDVMSTLFQQRPWTRYPLHTDIPKLDAHDLKLLAVIAQWLIAKRRARIGDALFEAVV
jgi:hypothetical protein